MKLVLQLLTYNSSKFLPHLFESLDKQTDKDWQFLILDSGSTNEERQKTRVIIDSYREQINLDYQEGENKGFSGGHQELWQTHDTELVLLVNHDVILTPKL